MTHALAAAFEAMRPLAQDALVLGAAAELPEARLEAVAPGGRLLCLARHAEAGGVSADALLLRLAARGFLPEAAHARRSPAGPGAAAETLNLFTRHAFALRPAREADLAALLRLERRCWPPGTRTPARWLRHRMAQFPRGQLVLEQDGAVLAAVYSQRVDDGHVQGLDAVRVHARHRPAGAILQLLALNVLPEAQDRGYGDLLLEFMLQRCAVLEGVTTVIGVTRCRDEARAAGVGMAGYIRLRDAQGQPADAVLRFHELHGAAIVEAVPGYRPRDPLNQGCGVLVRYDVHGRVPPAAQAPAAQPAAVSEARLREILERLLRQGGRAVPMDLPLFEAGLDSADLLGLRAALRRELGVALEPAFFFEHNTGERILAWLCRHLGAARADDAPPPRAAASPAAAQPASREDDRAIAIVGMACRFPGGADDPRRFWELLWEGREAIGTLPPGRWTWPAGIDPRGAQRGIDRGGFLAGVDCFDARFFRISPREAARMDPQQRLLLELAWACLEDAAQAPGALAGSATGVFVGASGSDYQQRWAELLAGDVGPEFAVCGATALIANRISYALDLRGPSLQVDTACSSSLVALHQAVQALRLGQCAQALVGGVNVLAHPATSVAYHKAGMLSPEGRCRSFDAAADGYVRAEGAAMVLLKPLAAARRDGDRILALVRGTAVNHGGQAAGLTVPNPAQQAQLVLAACADAGLGPRALGYLEAHGTGTPLGDPVEVQGLREAFAQAPGESDLPARCGLGSVKSNIGHLEAAAGLAGLVKAVLALRHRRLPASLHLRQPNPHLRLDGTPLFLVRERMEWDAPPAGAPRRAGVSSFGSGGANAHAVLEEYAEAEAPRAAHDGTPLAVVLSARDGERLRERARQLLHAIDAGEVQPRQLPDLAFTLQTGRDPMAARLGLLAASMTQLRERLAAFLAGTPQAEGVLLGQAAQGRAPAAASQPAGQEEALRHWIAGGAVDWRSLYREPLPRRIGLPTYPFARERHWLPDAAPRAAAALPAAPAPALAPPATPRAKPTGIVLRPVSGAQAPVEVRIPQVAGAEDGSAPAPAAAAPAEPMTGQAAPAPAPAAPAAPRAGPAPEQLERELAASLAEALLLDPAEVAPEAQFVSLGLDSISGVEWVRALNRRYGTALPATIVYAHPSVRQLAVHLAGAMPAAAAPAVDPTPAVTQAPALAPAPAVTPAPRAAIPAPALDQPIAIVGMSGRYPGARDLEEFWDTIVQGRDAIGEVPPARWEIARFYDPRPQTEGKTYSKWLGVLEGVDEFDAGFFGLSPAEAEQMDPQQRLFLQEAWRALEDAGIAPSSLAGSRSGVYLGLSNNEYAHLLRTRGPGLANRLGNSLAIAAARIAYRLDLKGPAMALDTACSSSLVAAHLAVQALRAGEIDLALAGGVSLYLTPELHILMSSMGMLAPDGRCKPFDDRADGIVPGEGAGVLVLKRLADAERDGDPIHGLILASGINQDGRTNGITAPSMASQAALVGGLYARHGIHPDSISYVEMHGTGTRLGDPIELEALATAFRQWTQRRGFCRIGSVKANIGHVTAAAGVAGVHKVLLSMRQHEFGPLPHFRKPNAHFDFAASPFVVGTGRAPWDAPAGAPRRAAVSSFGISGTNAHLVLQEWLPADPPPAAPAAPMLVVLSARDEERLRERAAQLVRAIESGRVAETQLPALAHTLQVGRDAMEARLATAVDSLAQLRERLHAFAQGQSAPGLHQGHAKRADAAWAALAQDEDAQAAVRAWLRKGRHAVVLDLWVQGYPVDWRRLWGDAPPWRIALPGYPFARERHWVPAGPGAAALAADARLHPLVHRNVSGVAGLCFASRFGGDEPVLRDHLVQGQPVLPAAAQLEMARAALALAAALEPGAPVAIGQVAWLRPLAVDGGGVEVRLALQPQEQGRFAFALSSGADGDAQLHCQGQVWPLAAAPAERIAPAQLQARFGAAPLPAEDCYAAYAARGLHYGPAHRGLVRLQVQGDEILARWELPGAPQDDGQMLHPGVLDAALQAAIGWRLQDHTASLPFALDRLEVLAPCPAQGWAWLRRSAAGAAYSVDLDLLDDAGMPCARLRGFSSRPLAGGGAARGTLRVQQPQWEAAPAPKGGADRPQWVLLDGCFAAHAAEIGAACAGAHVELLPELPPRAGDIAARYRAAAARLLELLQSVQRAQPAAPVCIQLVLPAAGEGALLRGLAGMLLAARAEHPLLQGQVLLLPAQADADTIAAALLANAAAPDDVQVRLHADERQVLRLREAALPAAPPVPWRAGGVYLVTGGLGGIGLLVARDIARAAPGATLVLSGRAPLDAARQARLDALQALGARAVYRQADAGDALCARGLVEGVVEQFGVPHAVLHCAGLLRDGFLLRKSRAELDAVLAPKVAGLAALDAATAALPLEHLVLFSSIGAVAGSLGQADYAAANGFMDAFAAHRNALLAAGQRHGRTVSVNWPYWAEGGMGDAATLEKLRTQGRRPLATAEALAVLHAAMAAQADQWVVVAEDAANGTVRPGRATRGIETVAPVAAAAPHSATAQPLHEPPPGAPAAPLAQAQDASARALQLLRRVLGGRLKRAPESIDAAAPLEDYGIDSILVLQLTAELEKTLGPLPKTLFFEHQTLASLARHLARTHAGHWSAAGPAVTPLVPASVTAAAPQPVPTPPPARLPVPVHAARPAGWPAHSAPPQPAASQDIAIVGLAGRYPRGRGLRDFWDTLARGVDCIAEIPPDRWDWRAHFDADKNKPGKSYSKWGGFIEGVAEFDPLFFHISPREAAALDPQERLFLQCAWETLEDAGYTRERLARLGREGELGGAVGVFVGVMYHDYQLYGAQEQARGRPIALSGSAASIANRVSYFCNLHGPSIALDTMCSSSLTAIHLACESLRTGGCEAAIAGGVNVSVHPNKYLLLSQGRFASSKGRCEAFGLGGDGYVPGEGVGAVLLKRLADAERDGDRIHGVIKASAINHGGKTNGYSVPNPNAQAAVIRRAMDQAGVPARAISCIEAHGTGTALGDPIEIAGLAKAFEGDTSEKQYCAIGSAKSNIGHCESAAGIAGLTKVLLQMRHGQLAPSLHAQQLNPNIDFERTPFVVQRELGEWKRPVVDGKEVPRIAGISSFGAGGANAHLIVQEYAAPERVKPNVRPVALLLSARNEDRLKAQAEQLLEALNSGTWQDEDLADIAYTLQVGREAMEHRLGLLVHSLEEAKAGLQAFLAGQPAGDSFSGDSRQHRELLAAFGADEALRQAAQSWVAGGKLGTLLQWWAKGLAVDWQLLWQGQAPRMVGLPTYPFAREHHWLELEAAPQQPALQQPAPQQPAAQRATRCFVPGWEPRPLEAPRAADGKLLVLACADSLPLARRLASLWPDARVLDLRDPLPADAATARIWVDLTGCTGDADADTAWIAPLQAWLDGPPADRIALGVTRGLLPVQGSPRRLAGSLQAGLYRMLSHEYRRVQARHLDLDPDAGEDDCVRRIAEELRQAGGGTQVAWRGGRRYAGVLDPCELPAPSAGRALFEPGDVAWITGGTRGIGALCARHLAERHGLRRLVLGGREALPPREHWPMLLAADDALAARLRRIQALEALGVRVHLSSADLADAEAVARELQAVQAALGPVTHLFHAAGAIDTATPAFVRKTPEAMARVLAPKVQGAGVLLRALAAGPLRRAVLFSSVSAAVPRLAVGQADYAMANAHLDRLAEAWAGRLDVVSIQWPNWKDTGFGENRGAAWQDSGLLSLRDDEGLQLLDAVLQARPGPVVLPLRVDPARFDPAWLAQPPAGAPGAGAHTAQARAAADAGAGMPRDADCLQAWLRSLAAQLLRVPEAELDAGTPLADYGADSVMLAQLLRPVSERVGERLDPSIVYEHGSIAALARWLLARHGAALGRAAEATEAPQAALAPQAPQSERQPQPAHQPPPGPASASSPVPAAPQVSGLSRSAAAHAAAEPIAIVGMAGRFPGAPDLDAYWRLLCEGRSAIARVPAARWGGAATDQAAALLDGIALFDPGFFLLSEADARAMDPQARLLLEEALRLWHHAGYRREEIRGREIGVYVGGRGAQRPAEELLAQARNPVAALGQNYLAAHVSRFFDLHGPGVVVDTACSSALTALQLAAQALAAGEIEAAMVGGVNVLHSPAPLALFARRGILQPEPRFHLFDRRAAGVVPGEGCGWVLIKPLARALADGDTVYAVVEAVAVNSDGRTAGPVAPNVEAQRAVMLRALRRSGRRPEEIGHLEANGSGSEVTDLLELKAIESVYRPQGGPPLELGSVKPNIGHPLCAEGIAALIKLALMLHHGRRVPFLSAQEPMAHYDFAASPLGFTRAAQPWDEALPPLAALNCFGDGGGNAHLLLRRFEMAVAARRVPLPPPALRRIDLGAAAVTDSADTSPAASAEPLFWEEAVPCK